MEKKGKGNWYRLEIATGTKGAATLRQRGSLFGTGWYFQPVSITFSLFFQIQVCLLYLLLFILLYLLNALKLYNTIRSLVVRVRFQRIFETK